MRLRNKKTGEVWNVWSFYDGNQTINLKYFNNDGQVNLEYSSLAELNEEWEDYKPKEPLIKDEKIRRAVRAWAKLNNIGSVVILDAKSHIIVRSRIGISYDLEFNHDYIGAFKNIEFGEPYAIEELCGEEE